MYALFRGDTQRWQLVPWDLDSLFSNYPLATDPVWPFSTWPPPPTPTRYLPTISPELAAVITNPEFRRAFFRGLKQAADGPLLQLSLPANTEMDAYYQGLKANGVPFASTASTRLSDNRVWLGTRRTHLLASYTAQDSTTAPAFLLTTADHTTTAATDTLAGRAPLTVATIEIVFGGNVLATSTVWTDDTAATPRPILWAQRCPSTGAKERHRGVRGEAVRWFPRVVRGGRGVASGGT